MLLVLRQRAEGSRAEVSVFQSRENRYRFKISGSVSEALNIKTDVIIDYKKPEVVKNHVLQAINNKVYVVIGTPDLTDNELRN